MGSIQEVKMSTNKIKTIINKVAEVAELYGINNCYVVGGYPRSVIMNNISDDVHDLDFASAWPGEATKLGSLVAGKLSKELPEIYHRTGTVKTTYNGMDLEFQGTYGPISDNLNIVQEMERFGISICPLNINIYARDFTINTLIQDLYDKEIYDITGYGVKDIENKIIRTVINPDISIPSNPLIILRAIRFSLRYNFEIDKKLIQSIKTNSSLLRQQLSPERLQIELLKMLKSDYEGTINKMKKFGLMEVMQNKDYDIFEIIKDVDVKNFSKDLDNIMTEISS
jgi:tRNA nucleotidyltransferase (CCA-adding enzyme)